MDWFGCREKQKQKDKGYDSDDEDLKRGLQKQDSLEFTRARLAKSRQEKRMEALRLLSERDDVDVIIDENAKANSSSWTLLVDANDSNQHSRVAPQPMNRSIADSNIPCHASDEVNDKARGCNFSPRSLYSKWATSSFNCSEIVLFLQASATKILQGLVKNLDADIVQQVEVVAAKYDIRTGSVRVLSRNWYSTSQRAFYSSPT